MTKTLTGYDVLVYVIKTSQTMSNLHSKCRYWANDTCHKHFIFKTYVMSSQVKSNIFL